jgi:leader peptidase (prepilin peptidase) / N-methyltransferase
MSPRTWPTRPYTSIVTPLFLFEVIGFILGLAFGSFLNVCISRIPKGESIIHPGSRCPQCEAAIRWYDNIPLLSWLLLLGRCRNCKQSIPLRYPLVELAVGLWFMYQAIQIQSAPSSVIYILETSSIAILGFLLIGLTVIDWQTFTLPDAFTLTGIAIALFIVCTQAIFLGPTEDQVLLTKHSLHLTSPGGVTDHGNVFLTGPESLIFGRIAAIVGAALILLIIRWTYKALRHREGMGLGDVKLLAMIAAFLGFWPSILSLFIGVLIASLYGAILLIRGKAQRTTKLAFGSFLAIGGLISAQFGDRIINMYTALLR